MNADANVTRRRTMVGSTATLTAAMLTAVLPELQERHGTASSGPRRADKADKDKAAKGKAASRGTRSPARAEPTDGSLPHGDGAHDEAVATLGRALALVDDAAWRRAAEDLLAGSQPQRTVLRRHWLAPLARRLGEAWSEDEASFADVTIGLGRLQWLLDAAPGAARDGAGPRVVLAPTPGDGHVFGLSLFAEELREAGFAVEVHGRPTAAGVARAVSMRDVAVLGVGVSVTRHAGRAAMLVRAARRAARMTSRKPPLVIAGGAAAHASAALLRSAGVEEILDGTNAPAAWLTERLAERAGRDDRAGPDARSSREGLEFAGAAD